MRLSLALARIVWSEGKMGLALISAGTLVLEITLTRLFSVVQWYHYAFMAVGIGLLGFGASGSLLAAVPRLRRDFGKTAAAAAAGFPPTVGTAYLALLLVPFDAYRIVLEPVQFVFLGLQFFALVLPFLCAGLAVAAMLAADPPRAGWIYGTSLLGSGLGCLVAVGALQFLAAPNALLVAAGLGTAAAGILWRSQRSRWSTPLLVTAALLIAAAPAGSLPLRLSPYKALSIYRQFPGMQVVFTGWNAVARVDVVKSAAIHSAAGLSYAYGDALPQMFAITIDGDAPRPLPASLETRFTEFIPSSVAYALRRGRTLVLEGGAGLEVLGALHHAMPEVVVVENNPLVLKAAATLSSAVYRDPRVRMVREDSRVFIRRADSRFDIIHLPPRESFQVVASGAYSLTEHYLYTVEAFTDLSRRLSPAGIVVVTRWLQQPPSEEVRAWAAAVTALEQLGLPPAAHLAAIRSLNTATILLSAQPWTPEEVEHLRRFTASRRFDIIFAPGVSDSETNQYNVLPDDVYHAGFKAVLRPEDRVRYTAGNLFDIAAVRDSRPFFFHYFRWRQVPAIVASLGRTWQPFGGGGYLVLLGVLGAAMVFSIALILWPLGRLGRGPGWHGGVFIYFLLLGIGYLFVEIPLLQQFILLLGHPTYALSIVLAGLLMASGIGSLLSSRLTAKLPQVLAGLALMTVLTAVGIGGVVRWSLQLPLAARIVVAFAVLLSLGIPMGVPFACGVRLIARRSALVPWAWAVNGCASVLSAIGAVLVAIEWGFPVVLGAAASAYAGAGLAALALRQVDGP